MKIIVLGGGLVGGPMAADLAAEPGFEVAVADVHQETLDGLRRRHGLRTVRKDLSSPRAVKSLVKNFDLVLSAVPGSLGFKTLRAVLEARKPVVDIAFFPEDPFLLAGAVVFLSVSSPGSSVEVVSDTTFFDSDRAMRLANSLNRLYSERELGSPDAEGAINWFEEMLPAPDMAEVDSFQARMGDQAVGLNNITVTLPASSEETILVVAPRDIPTVMKLEPLAYASATAMLLELIQVFNARPHQKTIVFLSVEDEATGAVSIEHFLDTDPVADDVSTILSFHELGRERTKSIRAAVTAPQNTTPGWYVQLVGQVLGRVGLELDVPGLLSQGADHALSLSRGDQVAGLSRGIASIRLYDDNTGNPSVPGLEKHGAAIERLILSLDTGAEAPPNPGTALLLRSGRYLTNQAITLLGVLMLLPTLAALFIWLISSRVSSRAALRHLRNLASFALPVAFVFLIAYVLARADLIPLYRFQVPTADGPGVEPRLTPTLILIFVGAVVFVLSRRFLGYLRPRESKAVTEMARLCAGFLSLLIGLILMLARSPFLMLPCLTAAWAWPPWSWP